MGSTPASRTTPGAKVIALADTRNKTPRLTISPILLNVGNLLGFAGTKDSFVLVNRVPRDPSKLFVGVPGSGTYQVVTDANTGLSILLTVWQEPVKLELHYRVVWMYGIAKGNANNGQRLVTA